MTNPEETVESLVQQIVDVEDEGLAVRFSLAIEVLQKNEDHPSLITYYSENMTSWAARGHAFAIERDAWEDTVL